MIDDKIPDEATLRRETVEMGIGAILIFDTDSMRDYHGTSDHILATDAAYKVIVALQSMPQDSRFREAYFIFHEGVRRIKQNKYLGYSFQQKISKLEKEVNEIALMHFGRVDPENIK